MQKVTLAELKQLALQARVAYGIRPIVRTGRKAIPALDGWPLRPVSDYHINIDSDGSIYISTNDFSEVKLHTYRRVIPVLLGLL